LVDPVWLKEVECKACGAKFKSQRVRSGSIRAVSVDTDFGKKYEGINPVYYAITTCPQCNYSARNDDFEKQALEYHPEIVKIALAIKGSNKNHVFPETERLSPEDAVKKHLLAISFYKHFKPENPLTIAGLYMHISWIYRENNLTDKETEYMKLAQEYYIKTYEKGTQIPEKIGEPGIAYLIGEIYRKQGNFNEAVQWFSRTVKGDLIKNFPQIEQMARDAWEKINEEKKKQNT
jgi:uncharacterized protein